jgi:hypothetical protein
VVSALALSKIATACLQHRSCLDSIIQSKDRSGCRQDFRNFGAEFISEMFGVELFSRRHSFIAGVYRDTLPTGDHFGIAFSVGPKLLTSSATTALVNTRSLFVRD